MAISIPKEHLETPPVSEKVGIRPAAALTVVRSATRDRILRRRAEWEYMTSSGVTTIEELSATPAEPQRPRLRIVRGNDPNDEDAPEEKPLTEIRRWAAQITHPVALTYRLICEKFTDHNLNQWRRFEHFLMPGSTEKYIRLALDRLVKVTNHEKYQYDFVVEHDPEKGYRLTKIEHTTNVEEEELNDEFDDESDDEPEKEDKQADGTGKHNNHTKILTPRDIARIPATTSAERRFRELLFDNQRLEVEEESELLERTILNKDEKAKEKLIHSYFRLIASMAMARCRKYAGYKDFWDLFNEGVIGLYDAIRTFDMQFLEKGLFSHAMTHIRSAIQRSCCNRYYTNPVRVPVNICAKIRQIEGVTQELSKDGVQPTPEEIADYIGIEIDTILMVLDIMRRKSLRETDMYNGKKAKQSDQFVRVVHRDGARSNIPEPGRNFMYKECMEVVLEALKRSRHFRKNEKLERAIYILRRLLTDDAEGTNPTLTRDVTAKDIGEEIGISDEWVRQIAVLALGILRKTFTHDDLGIESTGKKQDAIKLRNIIWN